MTEGMFLHERGHFHQRRRRYARSYLIQRDLHEEMQVGVRCAVTDIAWINAAKLSAISYANVTHA